MDTISATSNCGNARRCPPACTISAGAIASVSGKRMVKHAPVPADDATLTSPPAASMLARTTSSPTPRPEMDVTDAAVEKPGSKISRAISSTVMSSKRRLVDQATPQRRCADAREIEAAAVVRYFDANLTGDVGRGDADRAAGGLAGGDASRGAFEPMIGAIADEVRHRIAQHLDELPVEFAVAAIDDERDLLAEFAREIACEARQTGEQPIERLHARAHHLVLQIAYDGRQASQRCRNVGVAAAACDLGELVARENEFGHQRHHRLDQIEIDPHGRALCTRGVCRRRGGRMFIACCDRCERGRGSGQDRRIARGRRYADRFVFQRVDEIRRRRRQARPAAPRSRRE